MCSTAPKSGPADQAKTKAQLLAELNELRQRVAQLEAAAAGQPQPDRPDWYRLIFETTPQGLVQVDPHGHILAANPSLAGMLGYPVTDLLGRSIFDFAAETDRPRLQASFKRHQQGQTGQVEVQFRRQDGSDLWGLVSATPVLAETGEFLFSVGLLTDITERKRTEAALRASEARFATVFRASLLSISITRLEDRQIIDVNPAWVTKSGFSREEALGRTPLELNLWVNPDQREQLLKRLVEQGTAPGLEMQMRLKSGAVVDVLLSAELIDLAGQRCILAITQNITERKQAEAALRASEARFATIFRASPLSISLVRIKDSQIIDVNEMWQKRTGFSREEALGRTPLELNLWSNPADRERLIRQLRQHGTVQAFETQIRLKSGAVDDVLMSAEVVEVAGEPCLLALSQGITDRKQMEQALRTSEQKLRQIIEHSGDGIVLIDHMGQVIEWNQTTEQITGLTRAETVDRPSWDVQFQLLPVERRTPAMLERLKSFAQSYLQTGQDALLNQMLEFELQRSDGSYRDIQEVDFPVKTELGFWRGCIIRDMTKRKQIERIEAAQLAVNRILAESPEGGATLGRVLESVAVGLNWQVAELWRPGEDSSRLTWQDGWRAPNQPDLAEFERASQTYTFGPDEGLTGIAWQSGEAIWEPAFSSRPTFNRAALATAAGLHSATAIPIIKDGITVGVMTFFSRSARPLDKRLLATLTDLGRQIGHFLARQEAEESLRRYEQMVSTTPDWMSLVDRNYVYQIVNGAYLSLNNKAADQIVGHRVAEVAGEAVFEALAKLHLDQALAGERVQYQAWFDFPGAGRRFNDVTYTPYRHQDGTVSGVIVSGRDITTAKLLEEHLHQTRKMETVGQLAAGVAHHYNNMLTPIIGYTSLALRTLPPDIPLARNLKQVLQTAEQMAVLIRQLLAFARKQILQPKPVSLNHVVLQLQAELKQMAPAPIEFVLDLTPEAGQVQVDPGQFEQMLRALVSNAGEAMPKGGRLTLTTANVSLEPGEAEEYDLTPGDYVLLSVQDTGLGLSEQVRAHLFEPFFTTKQVGQGMGLGLAMALGIAKQHGGHLLAESQPGQGATFTLYLPRLTPPTPGDPAQTILVVEAEPLVREFVAEVLSEQGYSVLQAATTTAALPLLAGRPEGALQLLLTSAEPDSPALIAQLRASFPDLKVIFLVGGVEELPAARGEFLLKPFTPASLGQKVRAVLATGAGRTRESLI